MKRLLILLLLFSLPALACSLTSAAIDADLKAQALADEVPTSAVTMPGLVYSQALAGTPSPTPPILAMVSAAAVNLRACPGLECVILDTISGGQAVTVNATQKAADGGTWSNVTTQSGQTGWINSRYIERE